MLISGLQKMTLLDFPGLVACTVFTGGCNFRCPYCQNRELVTLERAREISVDEVFAHLQKRRNTLEGVVISGGECTLQPDLYDFCKKIKELGYPIKLDTNGTSPSVVEKLVSHRLIDYVAMDIKNCREKYLLSAGLSEDTGGEALLQQVEKTVSFLMNGSVDYEFRTTVCEELFTEEDFHRMGNRLKGAPAYFIQPYADSENVLVPGMHTPSAEKLLAYRGIMRTYIENTQIRGLDL